MSATTDGQRILFTVAGPDTPGITARLTGSIAEAGAHLLDIEQVVVQGQLTLCLLVGVDPTSPAGGAVLETLADAARQMGLEPKARVLETPPPDVARAEPSRHRYAVTAIGDAIDARGVHDLARVLASHHANIETIRTLSVGQMSSLEAIVSLPDPADGPRRERDDECGRVASGLRRALLEATVGVDIDIAVQRERLTRRSKRLVAMDMDSTLIEIECIDELARMYGVVDQVAAITRRAMAGELDFEASLRERVALLAGMPYERVLGLASHLPVMQGAARMLYLLRHLGLKTAILSGGFTFAASALKDTLGIDYAYANALEVEDGRLTGTVRDPIVTPQRKADLLDTLAQREGISLEQTIAIGDGANDIGMVARAGLGIAFHAKAKLREAADTAVSSGGLDRVLYLLGLHARDVEEVLRDAPAHVR